MSNEDFELCPVGIKNTLEIQHTKESLDARLDAMMQRIEEKIDNMDSKFQNEFGRINSRLDKIDNRINALDTRMTGVDNLDSFIEEKINESTKNKVFSFVKWVVVCLLGSTSVSLFGLAAAKLLSLK